VADKTSKLGPCVGCGLVRPLTKDHIIPKSKGGRTEPSNIQMLCRQCNEEKADSQCWVPPLKRKLWR